MSHERTRNNTKRSFDSCSYSCDFVAKNYTKQSHFQKYQQNLEQFINKDETNSRLERVAARGD